MEEALSAPPGKPVALEPVYERVDRAEAAGRFLRWFRPDRATLVVAGRIDEPEAMLNDLTDLFGGWEAEGQPLDEPPAPPTTASRALLLDYPGSKSAWMLVLLRLPTLPERDDAALRVLRAHLAERVVEVSMPVAGEGFVSIVDGTHLAYTVVGFDGKPEHVPAVLEATLTDLENLARKPLDGPSLDYARWWAVLDAAFAYDRFEGAARGVQRLASHRLPPGALEGAGERLAGVTPETLRTFAASVTGHRLVVVAGDAKSLLPELRRIGLEPQVVEVVKKEPAKK
jgi:zinc protease